MNYTTFTAIIFTFHDLSVLLVMIFSLLCSAILYALFLRKQQNRWLLLGIVFLGSAILGALMTEKIFHKDTVAIEVVTAG